MEEIAAGVARHADLFHHVDGADVERCGERDDFFKTQLGETRMERGGRGFGAVAVIPVFVRKPPSDFHARHERRVERRDVQSNEAGKFRNPGHFHRPQAEAMLFIVACDGVIEFETFRRGERFREELHHARIGAHAGERREVGLPPRAQDESRRFDAFDHGAM